MLILPPYRHCAPKIANAVDLAGPSPYMTLFNTLDYPGGVVPITTVQESEQTYEDGINDHFTRVIKEDVKESKGMPLSVQVVGMKWDDELALGVMKVIEDAFKFQLLPTF